jgi:hypothetical protein
MQEGSSVREYIVPASPARFVVLHYHIFKNAGSTLEYALRRAFGERFATVHGPDAQAILHGPDIVPFLLAHPETTAISSHHLKHPKPAAPGLVVFDFCVLREPLDRLWSVYKHFRRSEPTDDLSAKAKELSCGPFFDFLIREQPHMVNDAQVNILANGAAYTRPPDATDLAAALQIARETSALGVVELLDQSLVAAEYFLHPAFPEIHLEYVRQNVSPPAERLFRDEVGEVICQQLCKMNQFDKELVSWASGEVRRRFDLVPDGEERLAGFRARCAGLELAAHG